MTEKHDCSMTCAPPTRDPTAKRRCFWIVVAVVVIGSLSLFFLLVLHLSYSQVSWRTGQVPIRPERRVPGAIEDIPWRVEQMPLQPEQIIRADDRFSELAVSQKGLVATGGFSSKAIHLLDIKTGERSQGSIGNMWVGGIAISPDASILAVGGNSCELPEASFLQIWDLHSRSLRKSIRVGDNIISSVLFHPAGKYVYCRCSKKDDPGIYGVDIETGHVAPVFDRNRHKSANVDWQSDSIALLAVSPDGTRLVLGTWMRVRVWNLQAANEELSYPLSMQTRCKCAAVSPDGRQLATAANEVEVWDFQSGKRIAELTHGVQTAACLRFSPDGTLLVACAAVASPDGTPLHGVTVAPGSSSCILVWRVADYSKAIVIPCQTMQIGVGMYFLSGTNKVLSGTSDGRVCVWGLDKLQ